MAGKLCEIVFAVFKGTVLFPLNSAFPLPNFSYFVENQLLPLIQEPLFPLISIFPASLCGAAFKGRSASSALKL
jgi:hypothetical protein